MGRYRSYPPASGIIVSAAAFPAGFLTVSYDFI